MRFRDPMAWMLSEAVEQIDRADRLQRQFFRIGRGAATAGWEPPVDIVASQGDLRVVMALPGVVPDCLEVVLEESAIVVRGDRPLGSGLMAGEILRLEIPYGPFERRIALPHGSYLLAETELENGCLRLLLQRLR